MALDRLTHEDARILGLEAGPIRGHTCKLIVLADAPGGALSVSAIRSHVERRLDREPRLRQRIAPTPLGIANPIWVDDAEFDIDDRIRIVPADGPVDRGELLRIVARLMSERLDPAQPLWRIDAVESLDGGGAALVIRIHHCMADGVTSMRMLSQVLLEPEAEAEPEPASGGPWEPDPGPTPAQLLALGVRDRARGVGEAAAGAGRSLVSPATWLGAGRALARLPGTVRRELPGSGIPSPLAAAAGPDREVAFTSVPLSDAKRIEKAFAEGVTVNDVVLAAVAGGLRRWLEHNDAGLSGLRVKVPVSLHDHAERSDALGNRDSFMFVDLPLVETDPVRRLLAINAETRERKRHRDAATLDAFLRDLAHVSGSLERLANRWAMNPRVFALNVSNVPGPKGPLFVSGAPLLEMYSLAEIANRHAVRASVLSASGTLFFGLCADAAAIDGLDVMADGIAEELATLRERADAAGGAGAS